MLHVIGYIIALALSYFIYNTKHGYTGLAHVYFAFIAVFLNGHDYMELVFVHFLVDIVLQCYYRYLSGLLFIHHIMAITASVTAIYTDTTQYFWYSSLFEISSFILYLYYMGWLSKYWFKLTFAPVFIFCRFVLFNHLLFQTDFMYHPAPLFYWMFSTFLNTYILMLIWRHR